MPNLLGRLASGLKSLVYPGGATRPGTTVDQLARRGGYGATFVPTDATGGVMALALNADAARSGPAWENSCVAIGLDWIVANFPQADLVVEESDASGAWSRVDDDPMVALLADPTPSFGAYDFHGLWAGALLSCLCDGNGYWLKARDATDAVRELWWVPHDSIIPFRPSPTSPDYYYLYRVFLPGRTEPVVQVYDPRDVVHFKHGPPDPCDDLKACAPLRRCLNEVATDTEVGAYTAAVLYNRGVPGIVAIFEDRKQFTQPQIDDIKDGLKRSFTGRNRGDTAVITGPIRLEYPGASPDDMALDKISRIPEARLCAALGIPPMILGLSVGDTQKSYANQAQAERQAWRRLRAVQGRMAEAIYRQLLPDFRGEDRSRYRVGWDYTGVEALQDDRDAAARRSVTLYQGGVALRSEARKMVGLPPDEHGKDEVYFASPGVLPAAELPIPDAVPGGDQKSIDGEVGPEPEPIAEILAGRNGHYSLGDGEIGIGPIE